MQHIYSRWKVALAFGIYRSYFTLFKTYFFYYYWALASLVRSAFLLHRSFVSLWFRWAICGPCVCCARISIRYTRCLPLVFTFIDFGFCSVSDSWFSSVYKHYLRFGYIILMILLCEILQMSDKNWYFRSNAVKHFRHSRKVYVYNFIIFLLLFHPGDLKWKWKVSIFHEIEFIWDLLDSFTLFFMYSNCLQHLYITGRQPQKEISFLISWKNSIQLTFFVDFEIKTKHFIVAHLNATPHHFRFDKQLRKHRYVYFWTYTEFVSHWLRILLNAMQTKYSNFFSRVVLPTPKISYNFCKQRQQSNKTFALAKFVSQLLVHRKQTYHSTDCLHSCQYFKSISSARQRIPLGSKNNIIFSFVCVWIARFRWEAKTNRNIWKIINWDIAWLLRTLHSIVLLSITKINRNRKNWIEKWVSKSVQFITKISFVSFVLLLILSVEIPLNFHLESSFDDEAIVFRFKKINWRDA